MRSKSIHFILGISLFLLINCKILGEFGILCPIDEFAISMFDETHHAFSETCENGHKEDMDCFCEHDFSDSGSFKFKKSSILSNSFLLLTIIEIKTFPINFFLKQKSSRIPNISVVLLTSIHLLI
jgi:hypothetical protein